jgi:hypothetical protein
MLAGFATIGYHALGVWIIYRILDGLDSAIASTVRQKKCNWESQTKEKKS